MQFLLVLEQRVSRFELGVAGIAGEDGGLHVVAELVLGELRRVRVTLSALLADVLLVAFQPYVH